MSLFNEAEQEADLAAPEPEMEEIQPSSYRRKKRSGKKEDLRVFTTVELVYLELFFQIAFLIATFNLGVWLFANIPKESKTKCAGYI